MAVLVLVLVLLPTLLSDVMPGGPRTGTRQGEEHVAALMPPQRSGARGRRALPPRQLQAAASQAPGAPAGPAGEAGAAAGRSPAGPASVPFPGPASGEAGMPLAGLEPTLGAEPEGGYLAGALPWGRPLASWYPPPDYRPVIPLWPEETPIRPEGPVGPPPARPVPEPRTLAMTALGIILGGGLGLWLWRG